MDYDHLIYPPAIVSKEKEEYYKNLTTEEMLENNRIAIHQAANAPTDKTLKEYYSSLKQPWTK